jgi:hypothetical protein
LFTMHYYVRIFACYTTHDAIMDSQISLPGE